MGGEGTADQHRRLARHEQADERGALEEREAADHEVDDRRVEVPDPVEPAADVEPVHVVTMPPALVRR
jgi:hypothetical protein